MYRTKAARYLSRLPGPTRDRVLDELEALAAGPMRSELDVKKLRNRSGFRLRVGEYRVLFERLEEERVLLVLAVRPRGDAYKRR